MNQKLFTIIVTSLLSLHSLSKTFHYQGIDPDGEACRFVFKTESNIGRLEFKNFSFRPVQMSFGEFFHKKNTAGFKSKIPFSNYLITAEGKSGHLKDNVLTTLSLVTVTEIQQSNSPTFICDFLIPVEENISDQ